MTVAITTFAVLQVRSSAAAGPCDIYAAGGTPCVAAHSMTRALFANYSGPLCEFQAPPDGSLLGLSVSPCVCFCGCACVSLCRSLECLSA